MEALDKVLFRFSGYDITGKILLVFLACVLVLIVLLTLWCVCLCRYGCKRDRSDRINPENGNIPMSSRTKRRRPPPPPPIGIPPHGSYGDPGDDDVIYGNPSNDILTRRNQITHQGMDEWIAYLVDGVARQSVSGLALATLDGEHWCRTPGFKIKHPEFTQIASLLAPQRGPSEYMNVELRLQGKKYTVLDNNGTVLEARGPVNGRSQNVVCAAIAEDIVIVGKSPADLDSGQCRGEVLHILGHLQNVGPGTWSDDTWQQ